MNHLRWTKTERKLNIGNPNRWILIGEKIKFDFRKRGTKIEKVHNGHGSCKAWGVFHLKNIVLEIEGYRLEDTARWHQVPSLCLASFV